MRLKDLAIIFHDSKYLFQHTILPQDLYLSIMMFSHTKESTYKPIIQYIHGVSTLNSLDYSALENTKDTNQRKIYNTLYLFDYLRAAINHWILSIKHFKQPYEFLNSIETLYEKIDILRGYCNHFAISDISNITRLKLAENAEKEIIKRTILLHKILNLFNEPFAPDLFDITEIDFQKITSRYLLNKDNFNVVDKHIKCTPKKAFDICSSNLSYLSEHSDFQPYKQYCAFHFSKFLSGIAKLGQQKRFYLEINKNYPTQPFSGYFLNEIYNEDRITFFDYVYKPPYAPTFKLFNPNIEEFDLLPFLVLAFAPNNHLNVFKAPIRYVLDHNRKFSFFIQGIIDSFIPFDPERNPQEYWDELMSMNKSQAQTVYKLQTLKKLSQFISFEIITNINKLLFANTSSEYNRLLSNLHETFVSLELYFDTYSLSSQDLDECDFTDFERRTIESFTDNMINCFSDVQRTAEELYNRIHMGIPLISHKEFCYWKFISLCFVESNDITIPENLAVLNVEEFCEMIKSSYLTFMENFGVDEEDKRLQDNIEEQVTQLIVRYCQYYDKAGFFQSIFNISKQHLLDNKSGNEIQKNTINNTNYSSIIFKKNPPSL